MSFQVNLEKDSIKSSECECPRGEYRCSHAAALVIHAIHNLSRTDVECSWNKPKSAPEVKSVEELYPTNNTYSPITREITDEDRASFYEELKEYGQFTGLMWILSPEPKIRSLPIKTVDEIILSEEFIRHQMKKEYLLQKLQITSDDQQIIHEATIGQRDNPSWLLLRKGRLTASNFGHILNAKKITASLVKRITEQCDLSKVKAINWGISNEKEGIKTFTETMNLPVQESGLWLDLCGTLGASPDGLVGENEIVEVKCPYTYRNTTVEEAISSKDFFIRNTEDGSYELKKGHKYWHQVQDQLYITGRDLCYFVVWTTQQTMILPIDKDPEWAENVPKLKEFYKTYIIQKLTSSA